MGLLLAKQLQKKKTQREVRILVLGLNNAGKSTILKALSEEDIMNVQPTQGFTIKSLVQEGFKLNFWDMGGQKVVRQYWKNYYDQTDALVYVIDSTDRLRIRECGEELQNLLKEDKLSGLPLLIFANKQDLNHTLPAHEIAETMSLHCITDRMWSIVACSAKTNEGLSKGMEWLINKLKCLV